MNKSDLQHGYHVKLRNGKGYKVVITKNNETILVDKSKNNLWLQFYEDDLTKGDTRYDIMQVFGKVMRHDNGYGYGKRYLLWERNSK